MLLACLPKGAAPVSGGVEENSPLLMQIQFAALKVSHGDLDRLREGIFLAKVDYRNLVSAAGLGGNAYKRWLPKGIEQEEGSWWERLRERIWGMS